MPDPQSVLLIATRQIGDVLLATPLLRTLRQAWPSARIDVLVYRDKGGMLEGNKDYDQMLEVSEHPTIQEYRKFLPLIFRKYDLAVNTLIGDRPHLYAFWSARKRVSLIGSQASFWKRWINAKTVILDNINTHTVLQNLKLAEVLGLEINYSIVRPYSEESEADLSKKNDANLTQDYAVIHPFPMWRYKRLTQKLWEAVVDDLLGRFQSVVITGGGTKEESAFAENLKKRDAGRIHSFVGKASFADAAVLLKCARLFIGPDTAMTHLAAASGIPTLAIYGPSNPVKWGPWPRGHTSMNPWLRLVRPYQSVGNVALIQGVQPNSRASCVPCAEEGCDRHKDSDSLCLLELSSRKVTEAIDQLLAN